MCMTFLSLVVITYECCVADYFCRLFLSNMIFVWRILRCIADYNIVISSMYLCI